MSTEIFQGTPEELKARLDAIIGGGAATLQVTTLAAKSYYLIIYS